MQKVLKISGVMVLIIGLSMVIFLIPVMLLSIFVQ
jgi:hypothetical protein